MPRLSEERARRREQAVVEAALRCFARDGLRHTSMSDLFEEAGMSAGSVYSWFDGKDDIIAAAYTGSGAESAELIAGLLDEAVDPLEGVADVLRAAATLFDDSRWRMISRVNVQLWGEALVNDRVRDSFMDDFRAYRELFAAALRAAREEGDIDEVIDPEAGAYVLWGLYLGLEVQKAWDEELDAHAYADAAARLILGAR